MKITLFVCSFFFLTNVWSMGDGRLGRISPTADAMGGTVTTLNQITPEQETEPSLEEVQKQQEMDADYERRQQSAFPEELKKKPSEERKTSPGPVLQPLP